VGPLHVERRLQRPAEVGINRVDRLYWCSSTRKADCTLATEPVAFTNRLRGPTPVTVSPCALRKLLTAVTSATAGACRACICSSESQAAPPSRCAEIVLSSPLPSCNLSQTVISMGPDRLTGPRSVACEISAGNPLAPPLPAQPLRCLSYSSQQRSNTRQPPMQAWDDAPHSHAHPGEQRRM
jgi:hypothetical protein